MKKVFAIIAILCIVSMAFAVAACQPTDDTMPSGQPSGSIAPSDDIDSGDTTPSGSVESGEVIPSGNINSGNILSGEIPSGSISSGEITSGEVGSGEVGSGEIGSGEQPTYIQSITDLVENYSDVVYSALNDYYLENIGRACFGRTFKTSKVLSCEWDIGNGEEISKIDMILTYEGSNDCVEYVIDTAIINSPINVKELQVDKIRDILQSKAEDITCSQSYSFVYDTSIQNDRADLTKAICDKVFGENENATRYIVDNGYSGTDPILSEVNDFKVVEITESGIKETSLRIKYSSNDNVLILNLNSESNYRITEEKSYTISGNIITQ